MQNRVGGPTLLPDTILPKTLLIYVSHARRSSLHAEKPFTILERGDARTPKFDFYSGICAFSCQLMRLLDDRF
jgi:hypothetical protein